LEFSMVKAGLILPKCLAGCCVAVLLAACAETKPAGHPPRPVRVAAVRFETALATARYSGEVKVRREPALSFQVPGKLAKRLVDVGSAVKPGQLLATLDPPDYQFNQAGAAAQLSAAQAELSQARNELRHVENLLAKELASPAHYERRREAVRAAEARLAQAQAGLDINARKSAYTELRAEQAGVITAAEAEAGQVVAAGQTIFRLARTDEKEVAINVPENRLDDLRAADAIRVSLWAKPGASYAAKVREISPGVDALLRTFTVKVSIVGAGEEVRMGMTATVHVQREEPRPVAWLPLAALGQSGGQPSVWVVDPAAQTVRRQAVELAGYDAEHAKILGGVRAGDWVVTAGAHKLSPGEKVRLLAEGGQ
jgi:multidrug efflux system membrane fusion protein